MATANGMDTADARSAVHQLRDLRSRVSVDGQVIDEKIRRELLNEARALAQSLENDGEILSRTQWGLWEVVSLDIAIDMGVLKVMATNSRPQSADSLAAACDVETLLMQRVLRCLGSYGAVDVTASGKGPLYSANKVSRLYTTERGIVHMRWNFEFLFAAWLRVPAKLKENKYRSLHGATHTVVTDLAGSPEATLWEILTPEQIRTANVYMPSYNLEHRNWLDVYPAEERLVKDAKEQHDAVLFLDIGGNTGSQAAAFRRRFPNAPGRIIVQDLVQTLQDTEEGIEAMPHDFFTPQPVKGARAYYLRYIMHDWSDEDNIRILKHLEEAMEPGYSKLLINDMSLPDEAVSTLMASNDLNMMAILGGEERSERRHREYIEAAGLKITGIWDPKDGSTEAVFECEPA